MYAGKPDNDKDFEYTQVEGLNVYIDKKSPIEPDGLKVDLKGIGIFKKLVIDGFQV